jgi:D-alanyl-lipoteichoic acid acyltransferase DltB (MBOAT superfamily)
MHFIQIDFVWFMVIVFSVYWGVQHPKIEPFVGELLRWTRMALLAFPMEILAKVRGPEHPDVQGMRARVAADIASPGRVAQNILLALASAVFYGYVHQWFLLLLYFSAVLDYNVGLAIARDEARKRMYLGFSLLGNLGMLAVFKYYNFFVENVIIALQSMGLELNFWTLHVLLPVGISFYTFQTMSYTIDVYRGQLKPRRNFLDYVVYVSFFPQLVAGPIERASSLLPQVEKPRIFDTDRIMSGFGLALWGAFKKVCIADTLASYVDEVFMTREPAFIMVMMGGFAFGVQMLADFSGYTDIARGTARMLGFHLVENFNRPYSAHTTPEFWRKWHISLSSWVGDYVYTPLLRTGRPGAGRTFMALMVTFFLIGLWHGASWNFIALGMYNGLWMVVYTFGTPWVPRKVRNYWLSGGVAWIFHTLVVLQPTGLMFREVSLARVWQHLSQPWFGGTDLEWTAAAIVGSMALLGTLPMNFSFWVEDHVLPKLKKSQWYIPIQTTFWSLEILIIFIFYRDSTEDFIYFQF